MNPTEKAISVRIMLRQVSFFHYHHPSPPQKKKKKRKQTHEKEVKDILITRIAATFGGQQVTFLTPPDPKRETATIVKI